MNFTTAKIKTTSREIDPDIINFIETYNTIFEQYPLQSLANEGELGAYKHNGFWQCMDTLRDKNNLEELWSKNLAPWKKW